MDELDNEVLNILRSDLLTYPKIKEILEEKQKRKNAQRSIEVQRLADYKASLADAKIKISRLLTLVENGVMESSDPALSAKLEDLCQTRDRLQRAVKNLSSELAPEAQLSEDKISTFIDAMQKALSTGDNRHKRSYLHTIIDTVQVDDEVVRIRGRKSQIHRAVRQNELVGSAVPSFVRKWRSKRV